MRFYPQLEGLRAVASIGVLTTHVAFQTRSITWPVLGPVLGIRMGAAPVWRAISGTGSCGSGRRTRWS